MKFALARNLFDMYACVVGTSRCGTTMLRKMIHQHCGLPMFNETHWLPRMYESYGMLRVHPDALIEIAEKTKWDTGKDLISANLQFSPFVTKDELLSALSVKLNSIGRVTIQEFSQCYSEVMFGEATFWGDKTPDYGYYMNLIQSLWPSCRFVHIVRDGLATARSMSKHSGSQIMVPAGYDNWCWLSYDSLARHLLPREVSLSRYVASWSRRIARIRDEASRLESGTYLEVQYEKLVDKPAEIMTQVCDFLDLDGQIEKCAEMVRRPKPNQELEASLLLELTPDHLLALNLEFRHQYLLLNAYAAAPEAWGLLKNGESQLSDMNPDGSLQCALSVAATQCHRSSPSLQRATSKLRENSLQHMKA